MRLVIRDDDQCSTTVELDYESLAAINAACDEWVEGGEWGVEGAAVGVRWTLYGDDGDEIRSGSHTTEIEPDHDSLIRAAGGDTDCDHDWTSEGEGGCAENPGVWSTGGTSLVIRDHCRHCGLERTEHVTGSQRNPGEHDYYTYELPTTDDSD
jgi:hypothetical protein